MAPKLVRKVDKDVVVAVGTVIAVVGVVLLLSRRGRGRSTSRSRSRSSRSMSRNRGRSRSRRRSRSSIGVGAGVVDPQEPPSNHFGSSHAYHYAAASGFCTLAKHILWPALRVRKNNVQELFSTALSSSASDLP